MANPGSNIAYSGQALSINQPTSISLLSGGIIYLPVGNFYIDCDTQTAVQFFDANSGLWRIFQTGTPGQPLFVASDGTNYRVINLSGTISGVGTITAGTLYNQANATVSFAAPFAGTPSITATATPIVGGSLTFTVTSGGTGYTNPYFVIQPPNQCGGIPGLCLPASISSSTLTAGVISSPVTSFAGAGYVSVPTVTVIDAVATGVTPGSGAVITAAIANGTPASGGITGIVMKNPGAGYDGTHIPAVTFGGATGSGASATALPWMALKSITVAGTNTGYTASVVIETSLGNGTAEANIVDDIPGTFEGRAVVAQSGGVLGTPVIEEAGGGFQTVPLAKQVGNATADGSVNATFTAVVGGITNQIIIWQVG